jgi:hypothetical protein
LWKFRYFIECREFTVGKDAFNERVVSARMLRTLTQVKYSHYRASFLETPSGEPLLLFQQELRIGEHPLDVWQIAEKYDAWLRGNYIPRLFLGAALRRSLVAARARWYLNRMKNVNSVYVRARLHFLEEDDLYKIWN